MTGVNSNNNIAFIGGFNRRGFFVIMQINDQATVEGVVDLRRAGLNKVKDGVTSLEEINRVTIE